MGHKKRGYTKDIPAELVRDYKLFAIACEGGKREPEYLNLFSLASKKVKVDVIENIVSDEEMERRLNQTHKSAPKWVLDRAMTYIEKEGLIDEDDLWFVLDVDRWTEEQIRALADSCKEHKNWNIVISNPCFEVWLYFHKASAIEKSSSETCDQFKYEISTLEKGGYSPYKFMPYLERAIENARNADKDPEHFMPADKSTKVYLLAEALLKKIGRNDFNHFLESVLPELIRAKRGNQTKTKRRK